MVGREVKGLTTTLNGDFSIFMILENQSMLRYFTLFDFSVKYFFKYPLEMEIKIKNFADKQYQTYQNYPSPGRELLMTINYTIN